MNQSQLHGHWPLCFCILCLVFVFEAYWLDWVEWYATGLGGYFTPLSAKAPNGEH